MFSRRICRHNAVSTTVVCGTREPFSDRGCLAVVIRPISQILVFVLCMGTAVRELSAEGRSRRLRCFSVGPGLSLHKQEVADIIEAVRRSSRRPVITIEQPDFSDYAPAGAIQAVILTSGECDYGCSDRLWLRKGEKGWRVLKKLGGGKCWAIVRCPRPRVATPG